MDKTRQFALGAFSIAVGLWSAYAPAATHTLVYQGKAKMHSIKSGAGAGLPSFQGISRVSFKFVSKAPLPAGMCTTEEFPQSTSWTLASFTDGSNTYTPKTGVVMKSGQVLQINSWIFTACLDSNSNLTQFSGDMTALTQPVDDTDFGFASAFSTGGPAGMAAVYLQTSPGYYTQYLGGYGLSIGWDGTYSPEYLWVEAPNAFDVYEGSHAPTYSYK